jgi:hypothetical protein
MSFSPLNAYGNDDGNDDDGNDDVNDDLHIPFWFSIPEVVQVSWPYYYPNSDQIHLAGCA